MTFSANSSHPLLESQSSNTLKRKMASSFFLCSKETYAIEWKCLDATLPLTALNAFLATAVLGPLDWCTKSGVYICVRCRINCHTL